MAHRGLLREMFGFICMAVVVKETNKASTPIARNIIIDEITDAVQNSTSPPLMALPEFMTTTKATGFSPFILTLLVPLLGFFYDQIIEWAAESLLLNGLLPLLRIIKRLFLAMIAYANRCLLEMRARMSAFDDTVLDNAREPTNQIDEKSRSVQPQATPATSNVNGVLPSLRIIKRHFLAMIAYVNRCLPEMRARMGAFDDTALDNTNQIDEKSRSVKLQATPAISNGNEDGAHDSLMDVPNPTAISPEIEQNLAVLETLLEKSAEKDVQIQALSEEVQTQAQTIAGLDQRNNNFETELRTALDPTSLHPPSKDVVAIASDLAEDLKRVSTEAECDKRRLENAANDLAEDLRRVSEEAEREKKRLENAADDLAEDLRRVSTEAASEKERLEKATNDLAEDLRLISEEAEHQKELEKERDRSESNQLAEKENEITRLSEESTKLSSQIKKLEDEQHSSALATANTEQQAKATEKKLRDRLHAAEHTASNSYDERTYMTLRSQFDDVVGELNSAKNARQHAIDAQGRLATELEAEKAKVAQLQAATHETAAASQQSESMVETKTAEIQLVNERVVSLEREVQDKCRELENKGNELADKVKELEDKGKELEGAEARVWNAEEQSANDGTKIGELQRNLQATQDQAKHANESNTLLEQQLQKAEKKLEEKDSTRKPEAVETASTNDLAAEINSLRSKLEEAKKKANDSFQDGFYQGVSEGITGDANLQPHRQQEDASVQTVELGEDPRYEQVRQETLVSCEAKAVVLINEAIQQERVQGQGRLEAAVAQKEQAVKNSANEAWNRREADWTKLVNTQAGSTVSDRQTSLQAELFITQQRANDAQAKVNDAETRVNAEAQRAQAAELEIQKYKEGKAAQDERIKGYTAEIAALKRLVPTALQRAESDCSANDRRRAEAILNEDLLCTYDSLSEELMRQLLGVNQQITELGLVLKTQDEAPTRGQLLGILQDAYIDNDKVNNLVIPDRQVLFQQCRGAATRLGELLEVIVENRVPDKEAILTVLYKDRSDEDAEWNGPDCEFFANEDENVNKTQDPGLREKLLPKTRKPKPAVTAQAQDPQLPNEPRGDQKLKRKDNPLDLRGDGSVLSQYPQQGSPSQEAAGERRETMQGFQLDPAQEVSLRGILARQQQQRQQQQQQVQEQGQDNNNSQPFSVPASSSFNFNFAAPPVPSPPEDPPRTEERHSPIFSFIASPQ